MEEDSKREAVKQAQQILVDAGVEYWLFSNLLNEDGYESFLVTSNFHTPNQNEERINTLEINVGGLCHATQWILRTGMNLEGGTQEVYDKISFAFSALASKYNKHLQDSDPTFTGKFDDAGKPIHFK